MPDNQGRGAEDAREQQLQALKIEWLEEKCAWLKDAVKAGTAREQALTNNLAAAISALDNFSNHL